MFCYETKNKNNQNQGVEKHFFTNQMTFDENEAMYADKDTKKCEFNE